MANSGARRKRGSMRSIGGSSCCRAAGAGARGQRPVKPASSTSPTSATGAGGRNHGPGQLALDPPGGSAGSPRPAATRWGPGYPGGGPAPASPSGPLVLDAWRRPGRRGESADSAGHADGRQRAVRGGRGRAWPPAPRRAHVMERGHVATGPNDSGSKGGARRSPSHERAPALSARSMLAGSRSRPTTVGTATASRRTSRPLPQPRRAPAGPGRGGRRAPRRSGGCCGSSGCRHVDASAARGRLTPPTLRARARASILPFSIADRSGWSGRIEAGGRGCRSRCSGQVLAGVPAGAPNSSSTAGGASTQLAGVPAACRMGRVWASTSPWRRCRGRPGPGRPSARGSSRRRR